MERLLQVSTEKWASCLRHGFPWLCKPGDKRMPHVRNKMSQQFETLSLNLHLVSLFHAEQHWLLINFWQLADFGQGGIDVCLMGLMGDHDHRYR